jgi:hypothetical protein
MPTDDTSMDPVWSALRAAVIAIGGGLVSYGLASKSTVTIAAALTPTVAAALWGLYVAWTRAHQKKLAQAVGVQAGINLVVAGKALTDSGSLLTVNAPDATPPKPVTLASAEQIVKNFAPPVEPKAV